MLINVGKQVNRMIEVETTYKNTLGLLIAGLMMMLIFGWILKKEISKFKAIPRNKFDKLLFLFDNIHVIGTFCFGMLLILLAFI
ncbi:MAG: hypothetical protein K0R93_3726 [Anaerosolibacter sp.]|nr:hypothetical protein [Anaerosolibacter sp.]